MLIRVVRMTFREDAVDAFLEIFEASKNKIRAFPGCQQLRLLADLHHPNVFTTYSVWKSEDDLNNYRNSSLFGGVWPKTKNLFEQKPTANSYTLKDDISLPA